MRATTLEPEAGLRRSRRRRRLGPDLVAHVVARGEEEDRDAGVAQAPGDGEAVHVGQKHDVEDRDEAGARGLGFL